MTEILVVAAHPDDEVLGCGGTITKHVAAGDRVHVLILGEGATARDESRDVSARANEIQSLQKAAAAAARELGAEPPRFAGLPDNRLDGVDLLDVVKVVEVAVGELRPVVVYTHHVGDLNVDHRIAHQAVVTACRPLPESCVRAVYAFETVSSTEWAYSRDHAFHAARFVEITDQLETKKQALSCYASEMRAFPHARSIENIEALARLRGASVGVGAAEAFVVVREIIT